MMSVGCYDFLAKKWLVGPELKDPGFDPYASYFFKDMKNIGGSIESVRSIILQMYELSIAVLKAEDQDFKEKASKKLEQCAKKASRLFASLRKTRAHKSSPKSAEDAMEYRNDKQWMTADSSFKLLDKFGYLNILRTATQALEEECSIEELA